MKINVNQSTIKSNKKILSIILFSLFVSSCSNINSSSLSSDTSNVISSNDSSDNITSESTEGSSTLNDGCDHNDSIFRAKTEPTCELDGYTNNICLKCGERIENDSVTKIEHNHSYSYFTNTSSNKFEERTLCIYCGQTQSGSVLTKANNSVAYLDENNIVSGNSVGLVTNTGLGLKAYPALGYEFVMWNNGETNSSITSTSSSLVAIFKVKETALPYLSINLDDGLTLENVYRDEYKSATISGRWGDDYSISMKATFKGRGNGSWGGPGSSHKNGYTFKLNKKENLFNMSSKSKKWNIIANKDDDTLFTNFLAYNFAGTVFNNIAYQTENRFVNVYINYEYRGLYLLTDAVKVEKGRVPAVSEDSDGNYLYNKDSAGFLIEYDRYATSNSSDKPYDPCGDVTPIENFSYFNVDGLYRPFSVKYPDTDDAKIYGGEVDDEVFKNSILNIKSVLTNFSYILNNGTYEQLEKVVDIDSLIDMYLLHELFKNSDVGWSSFYMFKKNDDPKLYFGPAWDFDLAAIRSRTNEISGKHISTKSLKGDPNTNTNSAYNDIFVKAINLKNKNGEKVLSRLLNERFQKQYSLMIKEIVTISSVYTDNYISFSMNNKKWSYKDNKNYRISTAPKFKELTNWLFDRAGWMLNNDFVF